MSLERLESRKKDDITSPPPSLPLSLLSFLPSRNMYSMSNITGIMQDVRYTNTQNGPDLCPREAQSAEGDSGLQQDRKKTVLRSTKKEKPLDLRERTV